MVANQSLEKRQDVSTSPTTPVPTPSTTTTTTSSTTTSTPTSTTTSTSTSSTSTQTSSTSTSTSTSAPTTVSTPSSVASQTSSSVTISRSTGANGGITTITRTVAAPAPSETTSGGSGGGFWDNKTAVGATFGVAGVIGLVALFLLITTCLRRRRARKFDRAVSEAAAEAAATNADPFIGENDDTGYRGAGWDPRRRTSAGLGYGKLHDDPFGHGGPAPMAAAAGAQGMYAKRQSLNHGQYAQDAYGMNNLRGSGAQTSVYSGTTTYTSHPSYGGAGYYTNDLPPVPPQHNAYGRPSFGSTAAPGIAGVGAAGGGYGQDTQYGYRNAPGNSIDGNEDAYGGYARSSVVDPYPNAYAGQGAHPGPSSPRTSTSPTRSPPPVSRSPPPAAPPSYSNHTHGSQGNDQYYTRNEKSRPLSGGHDGGLNMPTPPAPPGAPSAAHFQPPDMTPAVGTPDESYNNGGRILRVANE